MAAFFQSVTTRTAGFETIPQADFSDSSAMVSMVLMFIGGSPMGTAGGVKTTTVAILVVLVASYIRGDSDTVAWGRKVMEENIRHFLFCTDDSLYCHRAADFRNRKPAAGLYV